MTKEYNDEHGHRRPSKWRYAIALSRFFIVCLDVGFSKSLGVLIRDMVERYDTDYKTMAFVCSIPPTFMYLLAPVVHLLMKRISGRVLSLTGGIIASSCLIASPYASHVHLLALCFLGVGLGMSLTIFPIVVVMNEYFGKDFIFWATLTNFGVTAGAFALPLFTERSLEAYGYNGAFLLLGGFSLNTIVCGATIRRQNTAHRSEGEKVTSHQNAPRVQKAEVDVGETDERSDTAIRRLTGRKNREKHNLPEDSHCKNCVNENTEMIDQDDNQYASNENEMEVAMEALIHIRHNATDMNGSHTVLNHDEAGDSRNCYPDTLMMRDLSSHSVNKAEEQRSKEQESFVFVNSTGMITSAISQLSVHIDAGRNLPRCLSRLKSTVIFREPYFTVMFPGIFLNGYAQYSWCLFIVPHAEWLGVEPSLAVLLATMAGISGVFGRITFLLADRMRVDVILYFAVMGAFSALIYFVDPLSSSYWFLSLTAVLQAISVFGMDSFPTVVAKCTIMDKKNFASAMSVSYIVNSLGLVAGNVLTGHIFDVTGSPTVVFLHLGGINALISVNCFLHVIMARCYKSYNVNCSSIKLQNDTFTQRV